MEANNLFRSLLEDSGNAEKVVGILSDGLCALADTFEEGCKLIFERLNSLKEMIASLHTDERDVQQKLHQSQMILKSAEASVLFYVESFQKLLHYAMLDKKEADAIKKSFKAGDTKELLHYTERIKKYFSSCEKCHAEFIKEYSEAVNMCEEITKTFEDRKKEIQSAQGRAEIIAGASFTGAVVATAVSAIAIGPLTLGVGLGIMTAGTLGIAGIAAIADFLQLSKLDKKFKKICTEMYETKDKLEEATNNMEIIKKSLESTKDDVKGLQEEIEIKYYRSFCRVFNILLIGIANAKKNVDKHFPPQ